MKWIWGTILSITAVLALTVLPRAVSQTAAPATAVAPASYTPNVTASQLTRDQMERFLATARIVGTRPTGKGITHTTRVTLTDGRWVHDAHLQDVDIYKAEYKTKEGIEKNFRDSYKFNIAAYRMDKLMELGVVPVCVPREVDGKSVSLDWWVDNVLFDEEGRREKSVEPPDPEYWTRQLNTVRNFDQLIYNEDRNQGNLLIDTQWKLWAIDHSRAFRPTPAIRDPKVLRRISGKMLASMKALNAQALRDNLLPYITDDDVLGLLARRDLLVKFFENEITSKGEDAVLTDMPRKTQVVTIP